MKFKKIFDELEKSKKAKKAIKVKKSMSLLKYDWKAMHGDIPIKRKLDSTIFNRKQGYEVIWMIQKVVDHFVYTAMSDVQRVEDIIVKKCPETYGVEKTFLIGW